MNKISSLALLVGILMASIILGSFYYASQVNKSKSIEKQQQYEQEAITNRNNAELEAKEEARQSVVEQNNLIVSQKASCAREAQQIAAKLLKDFCVQNENSCSDQQSISSPGITNLSGFCPQKQINNDLWCKNYKEGNYRNDQYESAYETCLQKNGLK